MDWFERHCISLEAPDLIVHVGAGRGAELAAYRGFPRTRILLLEPQAEMVARLREAASVMPNAEVLQQAVAERSGEALLHLFNLPQFSSLPEPTGLTTLFPGLASTGAVTVDTVSFSDLVAQHGIDCSGDNWLVLDAPGAESVLLCSLEAHSLGRCFPRIFLHAGSEPLFEGAEPAGRLLERFHALGYEQVGTVDAADADLPAYHLRLNLAALEVARLQALRETDLEELQERYAAVIELRDQQHELLVKLRQRLEAAADYLEQLRAAPAGESDREIADELMRTLDGKTGDAEAASSDDAGR